MTSELSFLIELLLKHKLPVTTKDLVAQRIKEVEEGLLSGGPIASLREAIQHNIQSVGQVPIRLPALPPPPPVAVIAQTPEAQAAMASRQAAINQALSGKPEKGQTSPRKF